jgi:hypothetical protein
MQESLLVIRAWLQVFFIRSRAFGWKTPRWTHDLICPKLDDSILRLSGFYHVSPQASIIDTCGWKRSFGHKWSKVGGLSLGPFLLCYPTERSNGILFDLHAHPSGFSHFQMLWCTLAQALSSRIEDQLSFVLAIWFVRFGPLTTFNRPEIIERPQSSPPQRCSSAGWHFVALPLNPVARVWGLEPPRI